MGIYLSSSLLDYFLVLDGLSHIITKEIIPKIKIPLGKIAALADEHTANSDNAAGAQADAADDRGREDVVDAAVVVDADVSSV